MTLPDVIARFEQMLASGKDTALLRFSLGNEYLKARRQADCEGDERLGTTDREALKPGD